MMRQEVRTGHALLALVCAVGALAGSQASRASAQLEPYDLLISGGWLIDGTANPWRYADALHCRTGRRSSIRIATRPAWSTS